MRGNDLLNKMELIDPEYIESASQTKRVHAVKRMTALLVAAVLVIALAVGVSSAYNQKWFHPLLGDYPVAYDSDPAVSEEEKRLFEIAQQYGLEPIYGLYIGGVCSYRKEYIGDYYYEWGVISTFNESLMFYFTNDYSSEIRLEHIQLISEKENSDNFKLNSVFEKGYGEVIARLETPIGWEQTGNIVVFYCEPTCGHKELGNYPDIFYSYSKDNKEQSDYFENFVKEYLFLEDWHTADEYKVIRAKFLEYFLSK